MAFSKRTKKRFKEAYEQAKEGAKEFARAVNIQGGKVHRFSENVAGNTTRAFMPIPLEREHIRHERRESHGYESMEHLKHFDPRRPMNSPTRPKRKPIKGRYMDLRPRNPRRGNVDWNNISVRGMGF